MCSSVFALMLGARDQRSPANSLVGRDWYARVDVQQTSQPREFDGCKVNLTLASGVETIHPTFHITVVVIELKWCVRAGS